MGECEGADGILIGAYCSLRHCNSTAFYQYFVPAGLQRLLKEIVREHARKEQTKWNVTTSLAPQPATA